MDYDKLIERLNTKLQSYASYTDSEFAHVMEDAITAIETLRAELARMTAERDGAIRKYEAEKEDFLDYALSGTRNAAPFCRNRHPDCVDKRGWCIPVKCHGFSRDKED